MAEVKILPVTIKNPFTYMGECAGYAYGSDVSDPVKNYKRGKQCIQDGHYRLLEFCDIHMLIDGYSSRVMREFMRHVGDGLTAIQRSTRYCNEGDFDYYTPLAIKLNDNSAEEIYHNAMQQIQESYKALIECGIKKEDAANILPLGIDTKVVVKHNARTMMNMAEQRLCYRALQEYRTLMFDLIKALSEYSPEWKEFCEKYMLCKCDKVGYCLESMSCGKYPQKD